MQKTKKIFQDRSKCKQILKLRPLDGNCYYQDTCQYKFCKCQQYVQESQERQCYDGPVYLNLRQFQFRSFVLKSQKDQILLHPIYQQPNNIPIQEEASQSDSQILLPKPKSNYCHICCSRFHDYRDHIQNPYHIQSIKNTEINNQIHKLSQKYQNKRKITNRNSSQQSEYQQQQHQQQDIEHEQQQMVDIQFQLPWQNKKQTIQPYKRQPGAFVIISIPTPLNQFYKLHK